MRDRSKQQVAKRLALIIGLVVLSVGVWRVAYTLGFRDVRAWATGSYVSSQPRVVGGATAAERAVIHRLGRDHLRSIGLDPGTHAEFRIAMRNDFSLGPCLIETQLAPGELDRLVRRLRSVVLKHGRLGGRGLLEFVPSQPGGRFDSHLVDLDLARFPYNEARWWPPTVSSNRLLYFFSKEHPQASFVARVVICDPTAERLWLIGLDHSFRETPWLRAERERLR